MNSFLATDPPASAARRKRALLEQAAQALRVDAEILASEGYGIPAHAAAALLFRIERHLENG